MKLKLNKIRVFIICLYLLNLLTLHSAQLFEVVGRNYGATHKENNVRNNKGRSLFDNYDHRNKNNKQDASDINFNQIGEKVKLEVKNENKNKKSTLNTKSNSGRNKSLLSALNQGVNSVSPKNVIGRTADSNVNLATVFSKLDAGHIIPNYKPQPMHRSKPVTETKVFNDNEEHNVSETLNKIWSDKNSFSAKIRFTQKEIKELKSKVTMLMEINSKLSKKIKKNRNLNKKHKKISSHIVSFIQKNQDVVKSKKEEIIATKTQLETSLTQKEQELKSLYEKANSNLKQLQKRLEQIKTKFSTIKATEEKNLEEMKEKLELKDLSVSKKLDVDGSGFVNKNLVTKSLVLGNLKMDSNGVSFFDENTKFIIGTEMLSMKDLMKNYKLIEKLGNKCGSDMSKCKILSKEDLMASQKKQDAVLENLRLMNEEAAKIIR